MSWIWGKRRQRDWDAHFADSDVELVGELRAVAEDGLDFGLQGVDCDLCSGGLVSSGPGGT